MTQSEREQLKAIHAVAVAFELALKAMLEQLKTMTDADLFSRVGSLIQAATNQRERTEKLLANKEEKQNGK